MWGGQKLCQRITSLNQKNQKFSQKQLSPIIIFEMTIGLLLFLQPLPLFGQMMQNVQKHHNAILTKAQPKARKQRIYEQ